MVKKIISLTLIIATLFTFICVSAEEVESVSVNENATQLVEDLGIVYPKVEEEYFSVVTRADFALYAARALGIDDMTDPGDTRYYIDMAMYDYAAYSVNCLVERGILSVGENRMFRPADPITYDEALKIVVCMLGYNPAAKALGGFPVGYNKIASRLELTDSLSDDAKTSFVLNDAISLLYEALIAPVYAMEEITISPDGDITLGYSATKGHTLIYEGFGYEFRTGILTGYDGMNIGFDVTAAEERAVVGNVAYRVSDGIDFTDWIGSNVNILLDKDNIIRYAYKAPKAEKSIEIDIKDFESYDGTKLIYNYNDNGLRTIDVSSAVVLYNGAVPQSGTKELFKNLESGTIKIIDLDGDYENDAIVVNDYKAYVFKSANTTKNIIYSKISGQDPIELETYQKADICDVDGNTIQISDIKADNMLNVMAAKDKSRIKIVVTNDIVSGTVESVWNNTQFECNINGEKYIVNKAHTATADKITPGQTATFLLNRFGEIITLVESIRGDYQVGFLSDITISGVFNKQIKFRMYTKNNGLSVFESADSIYVDGIKYQDASVAVSKIPDVTVSGDSITSFKSQMILFKTNTEGYITEIDTYNVSIEEDPELTLARLTDGTEEDLIKYEGRIGKIYPVNAVTDFYCVPQESKLSTDSENYKVVKQGTFYRTGPYPFECYKTMGKNEFVDVVLYHMNPDHAENLAWLNANMFLVSEKVQSIDKAEKKYTIINGLMQGGKQSIDVYEEQLIQKSATLSDIDEGDLICYRTAQTGKVIELKKLYDASENTRIGWKNDTTSVSLYDSAYTQNFQLSYGYVSKKGEKTVGWGYKTGTNTDEIIDMSSVKCMYYDPTLVGGNRFYSGSMDAIADYETAENSCDIIIVQMKQSIIQSVVVYKRP